MILACPDCLCGGAPPCGRLCVHVYDDCDDESPVAGATVVLLDDTETLIDSRVTGSTGRACLRFPEAGVYTVVVTHPLGGTITFEVTQTGACLDLPDRDVFFPAEVTIQLTATGCAGLIPAECGTIHIDAGEAGETDIEIDPGGTTVVLTFVSGTVSFPLDVTITGECVRDCCTISINQTVTIDEPPCPHETTGANFDINAGKTCFTVLGCNELPVPNVEVTFGGVTGTTDTNGKVCIDTGLATANDVLTWSTSHPRFADETGTNEAGCPLTIQLEPDSDYVCCPTCAVPASKTWAYTDNNDSIDVTYSGTTGQYVEWTGCYSVDKTGCDISGFGVASLATVTVWVRVILRCGNPDVLGGFSGWRARIEWIGNCCPLGFGSNPTRTLSENQDDCNFTLVLDDVSLSITQSHSHTSGCVGPDDPHEVSGTWPGTATGPTCGGGTDYPNPAGGPYGYTEVLS